MRVKELQERVTELEAEVRSVERSWRRQWPTSDLNL